MIKNIWLLLSSVTAATLISGCASTMDSTTARPVGDNEAGARLDLRKYDIVTIVAFEVAPGRKIDPLLGQKFAAQIFGRLKHDFGNLFTEVRFGNSEGKPNELIVTGTINDYAEGNAPPIGLLFGHDMFGKLKVDVILRDAATQSTVFKADMHSRGGSDGFWDVGDYSSYSTGDRAQLTAAARVANTIARGRGWQPSPASKK